LIDLHCHILPGLDDGAADIATSLDMAEVALADGVRTVIATPHVRDDYPFALSEIDGRTAALNDELAQAGIDCTVVAGAEVAIAKASQLDDATLQGLCLGDSRYVLIESPYERANDLLEELLFEVQLRGFRPVLAHPERSPSFLTERERLEGLVQRGVLCSITAGSVTGVFGRTVRSFAMEMLDNGLVHNVASDAHDPRRRPPTVRAALEAVAEGYTRGEELVEWLAERVPAAILATPSPAPPHAAPQTGVGGR
jgi:protein-tyrosine phosphatase